MSCDHLKYRLLEVQNMSLCSLKTSTTGLSSIPYATSPRHLITYKNYCETLTNSTLKKLHVIEHYDRKSDSWSDEAKLKLPHYDKDGEYLPNNLKQYLI